MRLTRLVAVVVAATLSLAGLAAWWTLSGTDAGTSHQQPPSRNAPLPQTVPRIDVEGEELPGLPRYPGSVRTGYERDRRNTLTITDAVYVVSSDLDPVRGFYREVFWREGWLVADYHYAPGEWSFLAVEGGREANVTLTGGEDFTRISITFSEPCRAPHTVRTGTGSRRSVAFVPRRVEAIAGAPDRGYERRFPGTIYLPPQVPDVDVHHFRAGIEGVIPDRGEDLLPAQKLPRMAHEVLQQRELLAGEIQLLLPSPGAARKQIQP